jgi:hypothetical protein
MPTLTERLVTAFSSFGKDSPHWLDQIDDLYAPDMVFHAPLARVEGRAAFRAVSEGILKRSAYVRIEDVAAVGDDARVMMTWTMIIRAKIGGERRIAAASELRIEGGRFVYQRDYWDVLGAVMSGFPTIEPIYRKVMALLW